MSAGGRGRRVFAVLRWGFALALLVYLTRSGAIEWEALLGFADHWPVALVGCGFVFVAVWLTAVRLSVLFHARGLRLTLAGSFRLFMIGVFFNTYLPGGTGGDLIRIYYGTIGNEGRRTEVVTVMLLDRIIGMFSLLILPMLLLPVALPLVRAEPALRALLGAAGALAAGIVAGFLVAFARPALVRRLLAALPFGAYFGRALDTVHAYRGRGRALLAAVVLSILSQLATVLVMLLLAGTVVGGAVGPGLAVAVPFGLLANGIPIAPGGLGVGEAAFDRLAALGGFAGGAEVMLGWRLLMFVSSFLGLAFYLQGRGRYVHSDLPGPAT